MLFRIDSNNLHPAFLVKPRKSWAVYGCRQCQSLNAWFFYSLGITNFFPSFRQIWNEEEHDFLQVFSIKTSLVIRMNFKHKWSSYLSNIRRNFRCNFLTKKKELFFLPTFCSWGYSNKIVKIWYYYQKWHQLERIWLRFVLFLRL